MGRAAGALLALAVALGAGTGPAAAAVKERLPSGLTVLVRESAEAPVVAASILVRVGSRWEQEDTAGITHLLQAAMVKGTATRSALEIAETAEGLGGSVNASGDVDFAEVRGTALARHWRSLLELMADVTLRPSLPAGEVEAERRAVLAALRARGDQPFQRALDTLMARLYGPHPYARPSLGRSEVVERLRPEALAAHHRRYYRAGRTIVSVSGQVPARAVVAHVARLFEGMPAGTGEPDPPLPRPAPAPGPVSVHHPAAQAQVVAGALAPPVNHRDYAAVKVLSTVLGGGMAGRLFQTLRDREGLAYATGAFYPSRVEPGALVAYLGTAPQNAPRAATGLGQELGRLATEGLTAEELARARAYLLGQFALDRRTNARLAWYQAFFEATGVGHDFAPRYVQAVEAVSLDDVRRVAATYLARPTLVVLEPPPR